ncbi:lactate utilization protein B/C [Mucilaginibacter sp. PPCGB 2223]|nr:lactate utilization protein B/C [Mucilaginibacter sp. PPCGB 2223]
MNASRDKILAAITQNQPASVPVPDISFLKGGPEDPEEKFTTVLTTIGGKVLKVKGFDEIKKLLPEHFDTGKRVVTTLAELSDAGQLYAGEPIDPHTMEDIELTITSAHFAVAENGAVWVTEELIKQRVLPFICQHLAVVVNAGSIVPTMHEAYQKIGNTTYGFGTFIAGPSKTADIEQSLVLGAHGPRSMTVFILG